MTYKKLGTRGDYRETTHNVKVRRYYLHGSVVGDRCRWTNAFVGGLFETRDELVRAHLTKRGEG